MDEKISLLLEEMIASQFVDGVARCCSMLFPKGKMCLVGCYILGLGEIWSASDSCFFGGVRKTI